VSRGEADSKFLGFSNRQLLAERTGLIVLIPAGGFLELKNPGRVHILSQKLR